MKQKKEGLNIVLTIDYRIQYLVETHLKEAVSVCVVPKWRCHRNESQNGRNFGAGQRKRALIQIMFVVFRRMIGVIALLPMFLILVQLLNLFWLPPLWKKKVVKESDKIFCENGSFAIADRTIREANRKRHGYLSVREVLKYSSNIGAAKIAQKLKKAKSIVSILKVLVLVQKPE